MVKPADFGSVQNYGFEVLLARYQQPGYYNDPDFLIVDFPALTLNEKKSHFALWSSFSAPLIISSYIPDLTNDEVAYLTNKDIIAVDQDPLALQATLVSQDGFFEVLTKNLSNGDRLLTVLNRGNNTNTTTVTMDRLGLEMGCPYQFKDLWTGNSSSHSNHIAVTLDTHATAIYRISGVSNVTPTGMIFNTQSLHCMTASGSGVRFVNCTGSDAQVWQVSSHGSISPLSQTSKCLTATSSNGVGLESCSSKASAQQWVYHVTGNLVSAGCGLCLQEGGSGLGSCGFEANDQVFGLPSGVTVVR